MDQKLTLHAEVVGTQQAAQGLEQVADAQRSVESAAEVSTRSAGKHARTAEDVAQQQKKAAAGTDAWAGALDKLVPGLGRVVQEGSKVGKVLTELGGAFREVASGAGNTEGKTRDWDH